MNYKCMTLFGVKINRSNFSEKINPYQSGFLIFMKLSCLADIIKQDPNLIIRELYQCL